MQPEPSEPERLTAPKVVRGTELERRAWNRSQARSGLTWNRWTRSALNRAVPDSIWQELESEPNRTENK